jgi:hypothetical protein
MELQMWRNLAKALNAFINPFFRIIITMYSMYVIYASLGMMAFGGKINENSI